MVNELERDDNSVPVAGGVSSSDSTVILPFKINSSTGRLLVDSASGSGTVTDVSVVTANGFAGTVANSTTTPAITLSTTVTGILEGNGTAISAASTTGSGAVVLANTPTLITPNIGAATGTSLTTTGALRSNTSLILEETGAGTDTITIQAPSSIAASYTLTLPVDDGDSGQVLSTDGNGVLSWASAGGVPTTITVANEATDTSCFLAFFTAATGDLGPKTNANLTFNSNTGVATFGQTIVGSINGNAATVTVADAGGDTTTFVMLATAATGSLTPATDAGLSYNATTNVLTSTGGFAGDITGNAATVTFANEATDTSCFIAFGTAASGSLPVSTNANMTFNSNTGVATFASTVLTTTDINGGTIDGTIIGGSSAAAITGTTITVNTVLNPDADGGAGLGSATLGFSILGLSSGSTINFANSNVVLTHSSGILTMGTGELRVTNAGTNTASVVTVGGTQTLTNKTLTSPTITTATLSGAQQLAEGAGIRLDQTLSADGTYSGTTIAGTAGTTLAFGDLIYLAVADSRWELCDADSATTAGGVLTGMCVLAAAADGDPTVILLDGNIRADAAFPTLTVGAPVYASTTAGDVQVAQPSGTDDVIHVVGFALTADSMYFRASNDYITHT